MPRDIAFIPSILKRAAKMAGIVNKVYLLFSISLAIFRETSKEMDVETVNVILKKQVNNIFPWTVLLSNIEMMSKCLKICNETTPSLLVVPFEFRIF